MSSRRPSVPDVGRPADAPIRYAPARAGRAATPADARFRAIFDHAAVGVTVIDSRGMIVEANAAFHAVLGYAPGELVGRYARDLTPETDLVLPRESAAEVLEGRRSEVTIETRYHHRGGETGWCSLTLARLPLASDEVGLLVTIVDVTERRRAEEALRESEAEHRALLATLPLVVYRASVEPPYPPLFVSVGVDTLGYTHAQWMSRSDTWVRALHPEDRERAMRDSEAALTAGQPLEHEYRLLAADGSVRWVHDRGELVPAADGRPAVWQGIMLDVTARRDAEAAERASEARLGLIYNSVSDLMFLLRVERAAGDGAVLAYRCESVNDAYLSVTGLSREELVGRSLAETHAAEAAGGVVERYDLAATTGDVLRYDEEVTLPTGRMTLETTLTPILDDRGTCTHLLGASRDVSARRRAESALRASETRHRALFEHSTAVQCVVDPRTQRIVDANEAAARFYGYPLARLRGMALAEIDVPPPDAPSRRIAESLERLDALGAKLVVQHRLASRDVRTVEVHVTPVELDGRTYSHSIVYDVTERLAAEGALRESEARVRGAIEASLDALFMATALRDAAGTIVDFTIVDCNARGAAMWGLTRELVVGRRGTDVFPISRQNGSLAAFGRVIETGEPYVIEYETGDPRALVRWVKLQVVRVGDGIAVTVRDITEQKQYEEALRGLALVDELTGVHNRRGFMAIAEREWQRARREGRGVVLCYIDLDDFKAINDSHGHAEGDHALRMTADVLRSAFRGADVIGRLGGDEFVVLVVANGVGGAAAAGMEAVEQRVRERIVHHLAVANAAAAADGRPYTVAMSVGTACAPGGADAALGPASLAALMIEADERLYDTKRARTGATP